MANETLIELFKKGSEKWNPQTGTALFSELEKFDLAHTDLRGCNLTGTFRFPKAFSPEHLRDVFQADRFWLLELTAIIQSLGSAVCIFLFALAVRNKLRLRG